MFVILEPVGGKPKAYLDRAKTEMERVLGFRGRVTRAKVKGDKIVVEFEPNPKWEYPETEKVNYLKEWVTAKVKQVFVAHAVLWNGRSG
jgi:hypothetical protein